MRSFVLAAFAALGAVLAASASAQTTPPAAPAIAPISADVQRTLDRLRDAGLHDDGGYAIVQDLVTQIGPRIAGSDAEARARDWAVAMLRANRFSNVHIEPFTIQSWAWRRQEARIVSPSQQRLVIAALGGSPSTPPGGVEAEIVRFADIPSLQAASESSVRGKIVFIDERMTRTQDGSGYGVAVFKRSHCAHEAQIRGAVACLIRSVGTDTHRFAHQGSGPRQPDGASLPTASVSPADANTLDTLLQHGPVRVHLELETTMGENTPSGNVIADIRGRERPDEIVLLAAHLDSWDLGQRVDKPRRTIRLLIAGSEEVGGFGGDAYGAAHRAEHHVIAAESDFGADRIYAFRTRFAPEALPYARAIQRALSPLGVNLGNNEADGGTDIGAVKTNGVPVVDLAQDGTRYFDYHHTADDTLAAIDPEQLRQNIATYAVFAYLAAEEDWDFGAPHAPPPASR
jgi:carboxypeptidase Q